tara:strand:- start:1428 stop:2798 length:1371 start_codon:yes stop_codon:yes gene_type:complete
MLNKKLFNLSYIEIFLTISYLICWFSISTSFYDIKNFIENETRDLRLIINFIRQFLNLIIFPVLITLVVKEYRNIKFENELLFAFASLYFIFQIPGLFLTNNSFINIIYIISAINILLIFILINIYFDEKKYLIFFYIVFLMLLLITILNYKTFVNFFYSESSSTLYTFFTSSETFLGKQSPRSTGSSRTLLLIMIISFLIFNKFFKKNYILKCMIYISISTLILLFQSRTTLGLLIMFILMNYIFEKNFSIKNFIKYFFIHILMPIFFLYLILYSKALIYNNKIYLNSLIDRDIKIKNDIKLNLTTKFNLTDITNNFQRPIDPDTYSSGRLEDWRNILSKIDSSIYYGFGAQGDRFLINQSASNGIIYAASSSGIFGIIPFIFFSILSAWIVLKTLFKNIKLNKMIINYSALIIILLLIRSILESSYAVFSLDFIVIYTFLNYLNKFFFKSNNGN